MAANKKENLSLIARKSFSSQWMHILFVGFFNVFQTVAGLRNVI
jgi:hypothetical protein